VAALNAEVPADARAPVNAGAPNASSPRRRGPMLSDFDRLSMGPRLRGDDGLLLCFYYWFCKKVFSLSERDGWRSLLMALASIWRIRSRVTSNCLPTSSSVWSFDISTP